MNRSKSIRILIVDDERPARDLIRRLLRSEADCDIVGECATGAQAGRALETPVDLVFLDIQLPDLSGLEVIARLPAERVPVVIFVTAHDRFAVRAFELCALDYLLKPFAKARFHASLAKAREQIGRGTTTAQLARLRMLLARGGGSADSGPYLDRLTIQVGTAISYLAAADIDRIEADDHYLRVYARGKMHVVAKTLSGIEAELDPASFTRIHRKTIVNTGRIAAVRKTPRGSFVIELQDGSVHKLSRSRKGLVDLLVPHLSFAAPDSRRFER
jgi:two-component system LytT family response regulator